MINLGNTNLKNVCLGGTELIKVMRGSTEVWSPSSVGYEVGIQVDFVNKTYTRLGDAENLNPGTDFDIFPMFGGRRRCNVADNGTINAYYGDIGYTEDGSNGQVMVYQPKFYYKVEALEKDVQSTGLGYHLRKANWWVSDRPRAGFKVHPAFEVNGNEVDYILDGAFEGAMWQASSQKYINDNVDTSIAYASGDLLCSVGGKKPISGLRTGMGTKANFEAMAQNRGNTWHLETIKLQSMNQLLCLIEMANFDFQTAVGQGVVGITDNTSYNCSSLTGSTVGNSTQRATSTINEIGGTETTETAVNKTSVSYRGVENIWGNIYKHIQGINIWGNGTMNGGQPYICSDFNFNESKNSDNYVGAGFTVVNANNYIAAFGYSETCDWLFLPSETGTNANSMVKDYTYITSNLNGYRVALLSGYWNAGGFVGGFFWNLSYSVGFKNRVVGSRLAYIPTI